MKKLRRIGKWHLKQILKRHDKWLRGKRGGKRADLGNTDLQGLRFYGTNLRCADLRGADLSGAILVRADLSQADLTGARLHLTYIDNCDFCLANLQEAQMTRMSVHSSDFSHAQLQRGDLSGARVCGARFQEAGFEDTWINWDNVELVAWRLLPLAKHYAEMQRWLSWIALQPRVEWNYLIPRLPRHVYLWITHSSFPLIPPYCRIPEHLEKGYKAFIDSRPDLREAWKRKTFAGFGKSWE